MSSWVCKASILNRAVGFSLCSDPLHTFKTALTSDDHPENDNGNNFILQQYIDHPYLLSANERRKGDCRVYLVIVKERRTRRVFAGYHHGYYRSSLAPYNRSSSDSFVHATNTTLQQERPEYTELADKLMMTQDEYIRLILEQEIATKGSAPSPSFFDDQAKRILNHVVGSVRDRLTFVHDATVAVELFGVDLLLDDTLKLWLLECNAVPALSLHNPTLATVVPVVVEDFVRIIASLFSSSGWDNIDVCEGRWQIVYQDDKAQNRDNNNNSDDDNNDVTENEDEDEFVLFD
jgi:hypothetical protein